MGPISVAPADTMHRHPVRMGPVHIGPFPIRRKNAAKRQRSRIRCDSARTSARVRASTTLDLPSGVARW